MNSINDERYYQPFRLNGFIIDPLNNRIIHKSKSETIEQKMMQVLVCLAHNHEKVVSREQLMDFAWPEVYVTEETLTRCISLLRKLFDDHAHSPEVIKTVRNRGYQLIMPVTFLDEDEIAGLRKVTEQGQGLLSTLNTNPLFGTIAGVACLLVILLIISALNRSSKPLPVLPDREFPFSALDGNELYPAISPDGETVAYAWNGPDGENWDIYLQTVNNDNGSPRRLTDSPETELGSAWSPDGKNIAFIKNGTKKSGLYLLPATGGEERKIADRAITYRSSLAWSPDGKWIAFADSAHSNGSTGIFLVSPDTGQRKQITAPSSQHWGDYDPSFSPDGKYLAFTSSVSMGNQTIFIFDLETETEKRMITDPLRIRGHTWTSDSKYIIFSAVDATSESLWSLEIQSGKIRWLNKKGRYPVLGKRDNLLAVENRIYDSDLLQYNFADVSQTKFFHNSSYPEHSPDYNTTGNRLVFISGRSGYDELWLYDTDIDSLYRLTDIKSHKLAFPQWSPDDRFISFNGFTKEGNADIFLIDLQTNSITQLTDSPSNEVFPSWGPDGRTLYFGSNRTGVWHIWSMRVDKINEQPKKVTSSNGYAGYVSEDGESLYFTRYDISGLWKKNLKNPAGSERVITDFNGLLPSSWQLNGNMIYYLKQMSQPSEEFRLMTYDIVTGNVYEGKILPDEVSISDIAIHPDLKTIMLVHSRIFRLDIDLYR